MFHALVATDFELKSTDSYLIEWVLDTAPNLSGRVLRFTYNRMDAALFSFTDRAEDRRTIWIRASVDLGSLGWRPAFFFGSREEYEHSMQVEALEGGPSPFVARR